MEDAYKIHSYLPLRYKNIGEEEYVKYLWKAFVSNYENEQYQFAFMSFHMLFMCFVYFTIWKIKSIHPEDFNKICLGFHGCVENSSSPFGYSEEQERKILRIFKFWGIEKERLGEYKNLLIKEIMLLIQMAIYFFKTRNLLMIKYLILLGFVMKFK